MASPAWLALTVQLPTATRVNVVSLTVQMAGAVELNYTGRPELAVADKVGGAVPSVWSPGDVKVMVCASIGAGFTVKVRVTVGAAA
ncbi:MAG: hypothetical protein U5L05_19940 [Rubrivivax sp.]|nr:hypothetical protein [Rubrivivax sp.]